jgi:hypothetical protein
LRMTRRAKTQWPTERGTVFFADEAPRPTISRAVTGGRVRRLAPNLYTADLVTDAAALIDRNRWRVVGKFLPGAIVSDRSAAYDGRPANGTLFVITSLRSTPLSLPGLVIDPRAGPPALEDDLPWSEGLRISSDARTLVDNIAISRARASRPARTLSSAELEDWLVRKTALRPEGWLENLRDRATNVANELGVPDRIPRIRELVSMVRGSRPVRAGAGRLLIASRAGLAWDPERIKRFDELAEFLVAIPGELSIPEHLPVPAGDISGMLPFFEAYFSNFIEGTEFGVDEAEHIITSREIPADRPADGHDILGTYRVVSDPVGRSRVPTTPEDFLDLLKLRHSAILAGRPEKRPGEWKQQRNQVGSYIFVDWKLVEGTLVEGFRRVEDLPGGFARAAYVLFLVTEVHPFEDGNGRVARAAMCAELSAADQARILIPIVWRNEYMTGLRALSRERRYEVYVKTLAWVWRWTAAMPWVDRASVFGRMESTHALIDSTDAENSGVRLELP